MRKEDIYEYKITVVMTAEGYRYPFLIVTEKGYDLCEMKRRIIPELRHLSRNRGYTSGYIFCQAIIEENWMGGKLYSTNFGLNAAYMEWSVDGWNK